MRSVKALTAAAAACCASISVAQQPQLAPHIGYLYPAGARQGATAEVRVGGQFLGGASAVRVVGGGLSATVGAYNRPLNQREINAIRDKIDEARKRLGIGGTDRPRAGIGGLMTLARLAREAGITEAELRALQEFQRSRNDPKKQLNPQIGETLNLQIAVEPGAPPGPRELRVQTLIGLSNPMLFFVGTLPEYAEMEPNDSTPDVGVVDALPSVINGQILPGDVDRFAIKARKGSTLVVSVEARALIPYLADAVPGWFQATAALFDAKGREVAYSDDYRCGPDPVLAYRIPDDGSYVLEIKDAIFRGREDFVYRVAVGELPYVTNVFPIGGRAGTRAELAVSGWNLPAGRLAMDTAAEGSHPLAGGTKGALTSNSVRFLSDSYPDASEAEPNDRQAQPQRLRTPAAVNGRIGAPGDIDVYRIEGRAGMRIVAEVYARRLGSPLDSTIELRSAGGGLLAANDDCEDKCAGLVTHQADSRIEATLKKDGPVYLTLRDAQGHGGPEYCYRLRVGPPRPDFELRVVPSSLSVRAGATIPVTVHALRRDGFAGDIRVALVDPPAGFRLSGGWVPGGQDQIRMTLTAPGGGSAEPAELRLEGSATIDGVEVRRQAAPAEDMMQAFAYRHLVPSQSWMVAVLGRAPFAQAARPSDDTPVKLRLGAATRLRAPLPRGPAGAAPEADLSGAPEGFGIRKVATDWGGTALEVTVDAAKVKPGLKGNLIVELYREPAAQGAARPAAARRRTPVGMLPAIPFEVVAGPEPAR